VEVLHPLDQPLHHHHLLLLRQNRLQSQKVKKWIS
jgi:hypothetical protein